MCCMHDEVQCQGMHDLWHCCKWSEVFPCGGFKIPIHGTHGARVGSKVPVDGCLPWS
uniref:Uncharacterized protein n=1 Tax=Arundo donax TaxID=35708 RepID=A0A0A9GR80_ARUDO